MFAFGSFWMVILWIVIIAGAVIVIKALLDRNGRGSHQQLPPRGDSALDILKKRYAAGEIDRDEFERRKKDIMST